MLGLWVLNTVTTARDLVLFHRPSILGMIILNFYRAHLRRLPQGIERSGAQNLTEPATLFHK